jgi:hypothetical protein
MSLTVKALLGLFFVAVAVSLLPFVAAGTMDYWQGCLFLVVFTGAALLIMLYLAKHDPALLRRRS